MGAQRPSAEVMARLRYAMAGPVDEVWDPPTWLMPHQVGAARRLAGSLKVFGGALHCDAVGLGKTYVALALASRYPRVTAVVPSVLRAQWSAAAAATCVPLAIASHESLSRRRHLPPADLVIVDEAHRFRNPDIVRYDQLACSLSGAHVLQLTATPVVNNAADMLALLEIFLPDHALAFLGIPSLAAAAVSETPATLARSVAPLVVARSPGAAGIPPGATPQPLDAPPLDLPSLSGAHLESAVRNIDLLRFPSFESNTAAALLRLHLFTRLGSSGRALIQSVKRHIRYIDTAIESAARGERLPRKAAAALFDNEDLAQREFDFLMHCEPSSPGPVDAGEFRCERDRLRRLLDGICSITHENPKASALQDILWRRRGHKTVVFTGAVATALDLADRLDWKRLAVVTGKGARIASGAIAVADALSLFAPRARDAPPPARAEEVETLLATDVLSEGLNLQDADGVVHYDVPWTPLRLQQRVGRVARLGSRHDSVEVWWFQLPAIIERRVQSRQRMDAKLQQQHQAGVAVSSRIGTSSVLGRVTELRERLITTACPSGSTAPVYALCGGPPAAAFVLRWRVGEVTVPEVLVVRGSPPAAVQSLDDTCQTLRALLESPSVSTGSQGYVRQCFSGLASIVRRRIAAAVMGPGDPDSRRLVRGILDRAWTANHNRNRAHMDVLDEALSRTTAGLTEGSRRELRRALVPTIDWEQLRDWNDRRELGPTTVPSVQLDCALIGGGRRGNHDSGGEPPSRRP
jgi:superfamily II DNA or RNA helicase